MTDLKIYHVVVEMEDGDGYFCITKILTLPMTLSEAENIRTKHITGEKLIKGVTHHKTVVLDEDTALMFLGEKHYSRII